VEAFDLYRPNFQRNLQNHARGIVSLAHRVTTDSFFRDFRYIYYGTDAFYTLSSCAARDLAPGLDGRVSQPLHTFDPNTVTTSQQMQYAEARISFSHAPVTASSLP